MLWSACPVRKNETNDITKNMETATKQRPKIKSVRSLLNILCKLVNPLDLLDFCAVFFLAMSFLIHFKCKNTVKMLETYKN